MKEGLRIAGEMIDGAELIVRTLKRLGASHAFNIPGLGMFPLVDAFYRHRHEIKYVTALNETNLALIANGYARASKQPAFVDVYHASGTGLAMMAVTTAWADQVPLVLCTTTTALSLMNRDQYAGVPRAVTEMSQQFVKWTAEVPTADRIPEIIERAFKIAVTPPFGPVHIAIAMDLLTAAVPDTPLRAQTTSVVYAGTGPDQTGIDRITSILAAAERPVVVFGGAVSRYGAIDQAVALAENLGCAVMIEPYYADLGFPTTHPQYVGKMGMNIDVLAEADACLFVDVELSPMAGYDSEIRFADGAEVVSISCDPAATLRQFRPTVTLLSTPAPALDALRTSLGAVDSTVRGSRNAWAARFHQRQHDRVAALKPATAETDTSPISLWGVCDVLNQCMPADFTLFNHAGTCEFYFGMLIPMSRPERYFGLSGKASAQGTAGPEAVGVQLARPGSRVVAALGDGGLLFTGTILYTASRLKVPVIFLICNNGGWVSIETVMRFSNMAGSVAYDEFGFKFDGPHVDLVGFAQSQGVEARRVANRRELQDALEAALASDQPWLIDVTTDPAEAESFMRAMGVK